MKTTSFDVTNLTFNQNPLYDVLRHRSLKQVALITVAILGCFRPTACLSEKALEGVSYCQFSIKKYVT